MYYNSIYSQLFNFIPRYRFEKIVKKSGRDRYCKHFTTWKQFLTLLFAQISGKDSLREIENALRAMAGQASKSSLEFCEDVPASLHYAVARKKNFVF